MSIIDLNCISAKSPSCTARKLEFSIISTCSSLFFLKKLSCFPGSFQVYGGEARLATLRSLFPLMEDKKSLASSEERAQIKGKASLLAAVDYYVSMYSDIFVSASPGNMHNAMVSTKDLIIVQYIVCSH